MYCEFPIFKLFECLKILNRKANSLQNFHAFQALISLSAYPVFQIMYTLWIFIFTQ